MSRIWRTDQQRMRGAPGPARKVGGTEVGGVKLRSGDLGDAVDAAGEGRRRARSGQGFACPEVRHLGQGKARHANRYTGRRDPFHECAS
jgi:hypothetical protein